MQEYKNNLVWYKLVTASGCSFVNRIKHVLEHGFNCNYDSKEQLESEIKKTVSSILERSLLVERIK